MPYTTEEVPGIATRADAKIWIIRLQFGRRNLSAYARGVLALTMEQAFAEKSRENKVAAGEAFGRRKVPPMLAEPFSIPANDTAQLASQDKDIRPRMDMPASGPVQACSCLVP